MSEQPKCELCGEPMPPGEEMFKIHGFSGNCPKKPLSRKTQEGDARSTLAEALRLLGEIVILEGEDAGVVLLSYECGDHIERRVIDGVERDVTVYDHEYFSPLGDALVSLAATIKAGLENHK